MRKAFNFYRSYYDVAKELSDKDKLAFLMAVLERQFDGIEPTLTGQSKFAYISQKHSIDSQILGYEAKTGNKINPIAGGSVGGNIGGSVQEKEKEEEQVKEKEKEQEEVFYRKFAHLKLSFIEFDKLSSIYSKIEIDSILDSIENYKKNTNYKSLFLTAKKWLEKEKNSAKKESHGQQQNRVTETINNVNDLFRK